MENELVAIAHGVEKFRPYFMSTDVYIYIYSVRSSTVNLVTQRQGPGW